MRLFVTFFLLLLSIFLLAQTPSVSYYGEPLKGQFVSDFIGLSDGEYRIFGNGYFDDRQDADIFISSVYENGNPTVFATLIEEKSQSVEYVAAMPDNRYITCTSTILPDQIFGDIKLTVYEVDGTAVNSTLISSPYTDRVLYFQVDEEGNIYLVSRQDLDAYDASLYNEFLLKYDADLTQVYSQEFMTENANITSLNTLPDGELVLFSTDYDGIVTGQRLADNGEIIWNQFYDFPMVAGPEKTRSLFDGTNIELILAGANIIWTIDIANGNITDEVSLPADLPSIRSEVLFSTFESPFYFNNFIGRFLKFEDSFWLVYPTVIFKLNNEGNSLVIAEEYPLSTGNVIAALHLDGDNAMMLLNVSGELTRFDFATGVFMPVGAIELAETASFSERVNLLKVTDDVIALGMTHNGGFGTQFSLANVTTDGALIEKIVVTQEEEETSNYKMLSLANDKLSLFSTTYDGVRTVSFWNLDGSLRSFTAINPSNETNINFTDGVDLADGRSIGISFSDYPAMVQFYEIDNANETVTTLGDFSLPFNILPGFTHPLEDDNIGFLEFPSGNLGRVGLVKANVSGEVIWESTLEMEEGLGRYTGASSEWIVNPTADTYLIGNVTRGGGIDPYYDMKVLDIDGNLIREFRSANSVIDATPIFANDEEIIVISTDYNLINQTDGEQALLYYQRYNLEGDLLDERIHELPYNMIIPSLQFLPNGKLALMGWAGIDSDVDALLIIMDEQGGITNISTLAPTWGTLQLGPNPGHDHLQLKLDNEYQGALQISLLDSKGQQLRNWSADKLTGSWTWQQTLSDIPVGTYWVNISSPEGQVTQAWIKQ